MIEQLDVEPAKYFVLVTKREKRACRSCEELGVASAPLPLRIIEKCLVSGLRLRMVQLVLMFLLFRKILDIARPESKNSLALFMVAWYGLHPTMAETVNYVIRSRNPDSAPDRVRSPPSSGPARTPQLSRRSSDHTRNI